MIAYFKNYRWSIQRRFQKDSPVYWRRKTIASPRKTFHVIPEPTEESERKAADVLISIGRPP
jgi:hypothetical protein